MSIYSIYQNEVLSFLQTLTIKFELFADIYAQRMLVDYGMTITDPKDNPYYQVLAGNYTDIHEKMYVVAVEDGSSVLFSKDLIHTHPRTFSQYRIGTVEYDTLCQTYPNQTALIKSMVYPATSLEDVINLPNLSIVAGDFDILHVNEKESIRQAIISALNHIETRWYVADYIHEDLYPGTFMSMVWLHLYQVIMEQRIRNIRTPQVHPYHIWEHLFSKGIKDYRDILTNKQALFLYRNISYLLQNKGKKGNLEILAQNILKELHVNLVSKTILLQTETQAENCTLVPEFISEDTVNLGTAEVMDESAYEDMARILRRIREVDLYPDLNEDHISDTEDRFGKTELNIIPTRLFELQKATLNTRYQQLLLKFLLENFVYRYSKGMLGYKVTLTDPNVNMTIELSIADALLLMQYAHYREFGESIETIPRQFLIKNVFKPSKPTGSDVPSTVVFEDSTYLMKSIVDVTKVLSETVWTDYPSTTPEAFANHLALQFEVYIKHVEYLRKSGNMIYHRAFSKFRQCLMVNELVDLNLTDKNNYSEWIASNEEVRTIITAYEKLPSSQEMFAQLCNQILMVIIPMHHELFNKYTCYNADRNKIYDSLKQLFVHLSSYKLTFLETDRDQLNYIINNHMTIGCTYIGVKQTASIPTFGMDLDKSLRDIDVVTSLQILDGVNLNDRTDELGYLTAIEVVEKLERGKGVLESLSAPFFGSDLVDISGETVYTTPLSIGNEVTLLEE